jgi:hypothetical protein
MPGAKRQEEVKKVKKISVLDQLEMPQNLLVKRRLGSDD